MGKGQIRRSIKTGLYHPKNGKQADTILVVSMMPGS